MVVSAVSDSDKDAMCEAIRNGVGDYAGSTTDSSDDVPDGGQEECYSIRGDGADNYASGMLRIHEFSDDSLAAYATALREDDEQNPSECFNYMKLAAPKDQQFDGGPSSFSNTSDGGTDHCAAESDDASVAAFTVTGAVIVVEFNVSGTLDSKEMDIAALRDATLPTVFDAVEG
ncbi:MAG TPA: hypothetical protein H9902_15220 [Candidatus Stackebrandtia faecavium]|nr:hypothetical protein [Candidatus Stackebrandtia faecavium]